MLFRSGFPSQCEDDCSDVPCDCTVNYPGSPSIFTIEMECPDDTDDFVSLRAHFGPFFDEIFEICSTDGTYVRSVDVTLNQPGLFTFEAYAQDSNGGISWTYTVNVEVPNDSPTVAIDVGE